MAGGGDMGLGGMLGGGGDLGSVASGDGGSSMMDPLGGQGDGFGNGPGGLNDFSGDTAYTGDGSQFGGQGFPGGDFSNISAPEVQQAPAQAMEPARGTTPTTVGGTRSDAPQGAGQLGPMVQDAIKQLQGGGQPSAPPAGQGYGGGSPTQAPSTLTPTLDELAKGQGFGGGSPTQEATNQTQLMAKPVPTSTVGPGDMPKGTIPGAAAQPVPANFSGGKTADSEQPFPPGRRDTPTPQAPALPRDENVPAPEAPKLGDATPPAAPAADAASRAAGPASTGPVSSRGAPGAGGAGGQPPNPMKMIGDVIQALAGNPGPLLQDLAGQQAMSPSTGQPYTQPSGRVAADPRRTTAPSTAPTAGSREVNTKPGAPDNPRVPQGDEQAARRAEWYKTHDRTQPFPEDTYTPQGPTKEGGTLAGPGSQPGSGNVNWQQIAQQPASTHAQNFGQPFNSNLKTERAPFFQYADTHPEFKRRLFDIMGNEQSSHPQGTQGVLESLVNRVNSENLNFHSPRATGWFQQGGYYDHGHGRGDTRVLEQSYQNVKNGANISNYATDNASNAPTRNAREGLARREVQTGRFRNQSQYGGEWLQSPGSEGNRPRYEQWRDRMEGAQPQTPTRPFPAPTLPPQSSMPPPNQNLASRYDLNWV